MSVAPLICFYKDDLYFYSIQFTCEYCNLNEDAEVFLETIKLKHHDNVLILQNNFCAFNYDELINNEFSYKLKVYILNTYDILSKNEILDIFNKKSLSHESKIVLNQFESPFFNSAISQKEFEEKVISIQKDISQGRFYQINLTDRFQAITSQSFDSFQYFLHFFKVTYAKYCCYLPDQKYYDILCFSPELFLKKDNDEITTQPIKGTLHSNATEESLQNSEKENAELSMIVDLLRNDLNSLSCIKYKDSARVSFHRKLLNVGYTKHTYSEVKIKSSHTLPYILKQISPGGSISGCPKIESIKKINEIENYKRDFYTGSIGWWKNEESILNLAIRSFKYEKQSLTYYTGCGIVFDSIPSSEWNEFLTKASFIQEDEQIHSNEKLLDTLLFENGCFYILEDHIERTILSLNYFKIATLVTEIKELYHQLEQFLKTNLDLKFKYKIRLKFNIRNIENHQLRNVFHSFNIIKLNETENEELGLNIFNPNLISSDSLTLIKNFEAILHTHPQFGIIKTTNRNYWNFIQNLNNNTSDDTIILDKNNNIIECCNSIVLFKEKNSQNFVIYLNQSSTKSLISTYYSYLIREKKIIINNVEHSLEVKNISISEINNYDIFIGNSVKKIKKAKIINLCL